MQTTLCENVSSTTSAKLPLNPTGLLPMELTDLRGPDPPFEVGFWVLVLGCWVLVVGSR